MFLVAVLAIAARAMVPAGYMPNIGGDTFKMVICSLEGAKTITVDKDFNPVSSPSSHDTAKEKCEFSILSHAPFTDTPMLAFATALHQQTKVKLGLREHLVTVSFQIPAQSRPRAPPVVI